MSTPITIPFSPRRRSSSPIGRPSPTSFSLTPVATPQFSPTLHPTPHISPEDVDVKRTADWCSVPLTPELAPFRLDPVVYYLNPIGTLYPGGIFDANHIDAEAKRLRTKGIVQLLDVIVTPYQLNDAGVVLPLYYLTTTAPYLWYQVKDTGDDIVTPPWPEKGLSDKC